MKKFIMNVDKINGFTFEFHGCRWVVKIVNNDDLKRDHYEYSECMGLCDYVTHTILINSMYPKETYLSTMFHEFCHVATVSIVGGSQDNTDKKIDIELQANLIGEFFSSLVRNEKLKVLV